MASDSTARRGAPAFDAASLTKLVPGFDFLQSLAKGASAAVPGLGGFGQWVAPTLDPQELEKKIGELRTVQFWLEQNTTLLKTTIQALEVQKMTLSTLASMNVPLADLRESLRAAVPGAAANDKAQAADKAGPSPLVDPMQWWNALAGQFSELAAQSLQGNAVGTAQAMAGTAMQEAVDRMAQATAAAASTKKAASAPSRKGAAKRSRRAGG